MNRQLRTIAVDLTPVLPGGENGGAKIFVLELLKCFAEIAPQTQFVLLTQAASHEELATLDRPNMQRLMVVSPIVANTLRPRLMSLASRILPQLPVRLRSVVNRLGYRLNKKLKRCDSGSMLHKIGVDLLFCPFTAVTYFECGIPTVSTIHDLQYKTYPEFFTFDDLSHRDRVFIEACRRATVFAAVSDYSREVAIQYGDINHERIITIYHRIAWRNSFKADLKNDILVRLGLASKKYLLYPANFWKHKNHEMLLTAFGMACHQGLAEDIKLICTGSPGARQEWLMNAAHTMNLGDRILFPGYLANKEMATLMSNCIGMVFPSLYEGFGLPVVEAMAAAVPVACSNTTSLPEVAGDAAILFDPRVPTQLAQAMISLVDNEALRTRLINAGMQRVVEFSDAKRMAREYLELFQYALTIEKHENLVTGIYDDGWAGPLLNIQVAPTPSAQRLDIEFSAPEWLPHPKVSAKARYGGKALDLRFDVTRGSSGVFSLPAEPTGGYYEIQISPKFIAAHFGNSDDHRELTVMFKRCVIVDESANYVEISH